ncbi:MULTISPECIES: TadE/TadG family type IV pilus assembly protein [Alphaproteobacteria]|uniref:TadE/TadG family type IV pilus assembly protein n=1 Tax=Alphaproteobacteria TaxID=28211 RepID=UPI0012BCD46E|nr:MULTISPECIES: TadE family protein [Alphaproteobacteria]MTH95662.1 pilus assembly protein [Roseibium sp. RKSG952]
MIRRATIWLRRFRRREDGSATIELLFWFPFFIWVTYSGVDLGLMSFHHANLERALDETIREVRLNRLPAGETEWKHDLLKDMICDRARLLPDCGANLSLEMKSLDPFSSLAAQNLNQTPLCADTPEEVRKPEDRVFEAGASNELMIIRACMEVAPVWISTILGQGVRENASGQFELHSTTVFVHEPA